MLPSMLSNTCTINRSQEAGTNGRTEMQELYTDVLCYLEPMNTTTAIQNGFSIGIANNVYFVAGQDVQAADQIIINGNTYVVKLIQAYNTPLIGYTLAMTQQEVS